MLCGICPAKWLCRSVPRLSGRLQRCNFRFPNRLCKARRKRAKNWIRCALLYANRYRQFRRQNLRKAQCWCPSIRMPKVLCPPPLPFHMCAPPTPWFPMRLKPRLRQRTGVPHLHRRSENAYGRPQRGKDNEEISFSKNRGLFPARL